MPGFLVHVGATAICPHGGQVSVIPGNPRVLVNGMPVATLSDLYLVAGCAFSVGPKPQPCVKVLWLAPATRVLAGGQPVILQASAGISQSAEQIPQGPPTVISTQTRVSGI
jgi:uncharacterized Zn-binding protein involved in type VI secretion